MSKEFVSPTYRFICNSHIEVPFGPVEWLVSILLDKNSHFTCIDNRSPKLYLYLSPCPALFPGMKELHRSVSESQCSLMSSATSSVFEDDSQSQYSDITSSLMSTSVDTTSTVFSDSECQDLTYQLGSDKCTKHVCDIPTVDNNHAQSDIVKRRQYYLAPASFAPKPYLHDSYNTPPSVAHSVDYVNDTEKLIGSASSAQPFVSQGNISPVRIRPRIRSISGEAAQEFAEHIADISHSNTLPRSNKIKPNIFDDTGKPMDRNSHSLDLLNEDVWQSHISVNKDCHGDLAILSDSQNLANSTHTLQSNSVQTLYDSQADLLPVQQLTGTISNLPASKYCRHESPVNKFTMESDYIDPVPRDIDSKRVQSVSQLVHCNKHPHSKSPTDVQATTSMQQVGQNGVNPQKFTHERSTVTINQSEASFLNPNQPLQYVDLGRFDGRSDEHFALLQNSSSVTSWTDPGMTQGTTYMTPLSNSPIAHQGRANNPWLQDQQYQEALQLEQARQQAEYDRQHSYVNATVSGKNPLSDSELESKIRNHYVNVSIHHSKNHYVNLEDELKDCRKPGAKDWRKHLIAYHNSLKRPHSADSRTGNRTSSASTPHESPSSVRARGKSLENIFADTPFDIVMPINIQDEENATYPVDRSLDYTDMRSPRDSTSMPEETLSNDSQHRKYIVEQDGEALPISARPSVPPRMKHLPTSQDPNKRQNTRQQRPQTAPAYSSRAMNLPPWSPGGHTNSDSSTTTSPRSVASDSQATGSDYMLMKGFPQEDSEPIMFSVNLPPKSRRKPKHLSLGEQKLDKRRDGSNSMKKHVKPKLRHSKSLNDELETNYLGMSTHSPNCTEKSGSNTHEDYICMSPSGDEASTLLSSGDELESTRQKATTSSNSGLIRPFDDLIDHKPYDAKKIMIPKKEGNDPKRNDIQRDSSESRSSITGSSSGVTSNSAASQNKQRFLYRLIRRNSAKERKYLKGNEECISPPSEPAIPEIPRSSTFSSGDRRPLQGDPFGLSTQQHRRGSLSSTIQMTHTYHYPYIPADTFGSNLTDEEKQQSSSLINQYRLRMPGNSNSNESSASPALPKRVPRVHSAPKMINSPAYMLVIPGRTPVNTSQIIPPNNRPIQSPQNIPEKEHDYVEPDLPPSLPSKTGHRRSHGLPDAHKLFFGKSLSEPSRRENIPVTDDDKASSSDSQPSSSVTSPECAPRKKDNWLLVNIPVDGEQSQGNESPHAEEIWVQRDSTVSGSNINFDLFSLLK